MSLPYRVVQVTERRVIYDGVMLLGIVLYLLVFMAISLAGDVRPDLTEATTALTRAFGTLAILMLHVLLAIGPLCRLNPHFLPLLINRRHLGVATFLVAAIHGTLATLVFHTGGAMNPIASILIGSGQFLSVQEFPFEIFGFAALLILGAMAGTSHDFWIACLSLDVWKRLHMLVYLAYVLLLLHVGLGVLQSARNSTGAVAVGVGALVLLLLHGAAARQESKRDEAEQATDTAGWVRVCAPAEIPENRAVIIPAGGERVAVFRHWQGVSAISNVCAHQGGPLGEGEVQAGCVRCPWHGAIYYPHNGSSPPPFEKSVATYNLKLVEGVLYVDPVPNAPGTAVEPVARPERRGPSKPAPRPESRPPQPNPESRKGIV